MVVGAFPIAKLGVLALKQISKPIANIIKDKAKQNPFFRKAVCMPPAQIYNWVEVKTKMWALNLGKPANIPKLTEGMAIELGANLLGEFIIFAIGAGVLIVEYMRQSKKEQKKDEAVLEEKRSLQNALTEMALRIEKHDAKLREMSRIIAELESRRWILPKWSKDKNEDDDDDNDDKEKTDKLKNSIKKFSETQTKTNVEKTDSSRKL